MVVAETAWCQATPRASRSGRSLRVAGCHRGYCALRLRFRHVSPRNRTTRGDVLALVTAMLLPILAVLLITLVAIGVWLLRIPSQLTGLPTALFILGGFAIFFLVAASWACRHLTKAGTHTPRLFGDITDAGNLSVQLPALSAALPFLLLIMVTLRLPLANPSPVFGLALLLVILLLGMSELFLLAVLPAVALVSVLALEHAWHFQHFDSAQASLPLLWYLGFYALFTAFPFIFHRRFAEKT